MSVATSPSSCAICSRSPAQHFKYRQIVGMLLSYRVSTVDDHLCRECSRRVGRSMQSATLITGWWGLIAVFYNLLIVVTNTVGLIKAATMPAPIGGLISFEKERSVFVRAQTWIGLALVGGIIAIGAASGVFDSTEQADWSVGSCVRGADTVTPVSCTSSHSGKIVSVANSSSGCPNAAEGWVTVSGKVMCIDEDR